MIIWKDTGVPLLQGSRRNTSFLLAAIFVSFSLVHCTCGSELKLSERTKGGLSVTLTRAVGRVQQYVYACRKLTKGEFFIRAIAITDAPKNRAKDRGFLRCAIDRLDDLLDECAKGLDAFEHEGNRIFQHCAESKPLRKKGNLDPRDFSTRKCEAVYRSYVGREIGGVWLCFCDQGEYKVVAGNAQFNTNAAPAGATQEVETLRDCTKETTAQLKEVCLNTPGDFELLALHILQTCCKRARTASDSKFQCAAAVPANVAFLKFLSFF